MYTLPVKFLATLPSRKAVTSGYKYGQSPAGGNHWKHIISISSKSSARVKKALKAFIRKPISPITSLHDHIIMKTNIILLLTVAASIMAAPTQDNSEDINDTLPEPCHHASSCSVYWSGRCESYCGNRGFAYMSEAGCPRYSKRCCCRR